MSPPATPAPGGYRYPIRLWERVGVELEYMIVDAGTLDVRPIADEVLHAVAGNYDGDAFPEGESGPIAWSNELTAHVIELKTNEPAAALPPLAERFQAHVRRINGMLAGSGARLMPTAMHPWMDPAREMRLWRHGTSEVYEAFDRIFSCKGHGWANLQSTHVNLPFGDDEEFGRLHAAVRLVLPILPALCASSPFAEGRASGDLDTRVRVYRTNCARVPSLAGRVIPERVFARREYEGELLAGLYRDIAPFDPEGILQEEWLNARGCIARFDRGSIEIRLMDIQECPEADLAIVEAVVGVVRALAEERWGSGAEHRAFNIDGLEAILMVCVRKGENAVIEDERYMRALGWTDAACRAGELWGHLVESVIERSSAARKALGVMLKSGTLATRILKAAGREPDRGRLRAVYGELCDCLAEGRMFEA